MIKAGVWQSFLKELGHGSSISIEIRNLSSIAIIGFSRWLHQVKLLPSPQVSIDCFFHGFCKCMEITSYNPRPVKRGTYLLQLPPEKHFQIVLRWTTHISESPFDVKDMIQPMDRHGKPIDFTLDNAKSSHQPTRIVTKKKKPTRMPPTDPIALHDNHLLIFPLEMDLNEEEGDSSLTLFSVSQLQYIHSY